MPESRPKYSEQEAAHDILAAEAFAVPAADPRLRHQVVLPDDPAGIPEPHDILAAEEFALPAADPRAHAIHDAGRGGRSRARWAAAAGAGLLAVWLRRRRR